MIQYQDTATGQIWMMEDGYDFSNNTNVPTTLSSTVVPKPSEAHVWNGSGWTLDQLKEDELFNKDLKRQIKELEVQVTERRIREAIMSGDSTFITGIDTQIAALRAQLRA